MNKRVCINGESVSLFRGKFATVIPRLAYGKRGWEVRQTINGKRTKKVFGFDGLREANAYAREVLQELGERRLEEALLKVAKECRARLDVFVKARARERIELMAERAYPKKERGKKSPRGKMEAAYYRAMSTMLAWMDATPEEVAAED